MKGVIFRALEQLVVDKLGMAAWNNLLQHHGLAEQVYISPKSYPDQELMSLVGGISEALAIPADQVVKMFGEYLFGYLANRHCAIMNQFVNFQELIFGIDAVIHKEVIKLYHEPNLPAIRVEQGSQGELNVFYASKRQLCWCAEGLIVGAAKYFNTRISLQHPECMHQGASECRIVVKVEDNG
ncbi:heme NO-binding domain-containing protein [Pseudoalteromonas fenneropenaei]|uniref:Heme NO-binding domain-containing protein n=1 Tax=Pseudoalteromonas fenneropenaei TaxID=1737459 RepID=A0ABV7CGC0_9GAMM